MLLLQSCKDECDDIACENGGTCVEGSCECPDGFSGELCEIQDLCFGVVCEFDGVCEEGECVCTEMTENYLIGTWMDEGSVVELVFQSDGSYTIAGIPGSFILNSESRVLELFSSGSLIATWTVSIEGFTCEEFTIVDQNGLDGTLIRQ